MVSASEIFTAKRAKGFFQPALAWVIILGFVLVTTVCVFTGAGKILNYIFPVGAFFVGVLLYFRAPLLYVGFGWWMWFIAPFVRRLADYRGAGFTNPSPILLAPYLVAFVAIITLYRHLPKLYSGGLPFVIALSGVIYGFLIGLINKEPQQALIALLDWLAPLLIGFHLFVNWRDYPSYRQNLERTFVWGVLIMGGVWNHPVSSSTRMGAILANKCSNCECRYSRTTGNTGLGYDELARTLCSRNGCGFIVIVL